MDEKSTLPRSPELMTAGDTGLLVVDVQQKLIGLIDGHAQIVWNIRRLIDGAKLLGLPIFATEQYPQGLGPTAAELASGLDHVFDKTAFSCGGCPALCRELEKAGKRKWMVCGIEAHVCIQQTVLDLLAEGFSVYVAADAVGSRSRFDYEIALRRLEAAGATLTTVEAALFEWCQDSKAPQFKQISKMVQEKPPT
ncbi:MAG TPA: hydrolase [Pirellulales bacterium]|nr:hydrolase [Pirellulales bacterium]